MTLIIPALIIAINFIILKFKKFTKLLGYLLDKRKKVTSTCDKSLFKKFSAKAGFHNYDLLFVILLFFILPLMNHTKTIKVPINPKLLFCLNKYMYNSEQNGAKIFDLGQNRNFL